MQRRQFMTRATLGLVGLLLSPITPQNSSLENSESMIKHDIEIYAKYEAEKKAEYDKGLIKYDTWVDYALAKSKQETVILVNKSQYTLDVLRDEKIVKQYDVELGFNSTDDKRMEGDGCTPEGIYSASLKDPHSRFHKGILISYPTAEDWREFSQNKKSGILPGYATIGGDVMIHGNGSGKKGNGEGRNWTLGCVALSNQDMDTLYKDIKLGTPLVIVRYTSKVYK